MNATILIVDDEPDLLELLSMNLSMDGYEILTAATAAEALESIGKQRPDLVLLDVMLPDMSGIQLTGKIKNTPETATLPVILLTAKDKDTDIIVGLGVGADDYITKPFSNAVLIARIEAILRRPQAGGQDVKGSISAGAIKIIPSRRQALIEGRNIDLTGVEYNLLLALIEASGDILSREQLKAALDPLTKGQKDRVVDTHIATLRKKLGPAGRKMIKTIHGRGYRLSS